MRAVAIVSLGLVLLLTLAGRASLSTRASAAAPNLSPTYVGAARCAGCHKTIHETWQSGRHSKMLQPATSASVKGDFNKTTVTLKGSRYALRVKDGQYFITESFLSSERREHRVEYTLGSRRIQHYLTTIENGWIIVLPPSWDVQRGEWFHNMEIVRPDEDDRKPVQQWNRKCFGCHVSLQDNHYNPATRTYATNWMDFGTTCERCHGPGSRHVERYAHSDRDATSDRFIVRPTALDATSSSMICAQCHSLRDVLAPGYAAGDDYYDYFMPILEFGPRREQDPTYWSDGRPRRFSNDAIGLWQSECFLRGGATCTTCHVDPHEPDVDRNAQLASTNNALCTRCHQTIGSRVSAHTRHRADSAGSSCVECHMPRTVISIKSTMRDHTISVPAPENTVASGIPNACNECHTGKTVAWAVRAVKNWWPDERRGRLIARANAFSAARARRPAALDRLIAIASDDRQGPLVQATALGYLRKYNDPRAISTLIAALRSRHPAIRAVAAAGLGERETSDPAVIGALAAALDDSTRAVRLSSFVSLISARVLLDGADEARFLRVSREYMIRARQYLDDGITQKDLGIMHLRTGEFDLAAAALENSLGLGEPSSKFLLAVARIGQRRLDDARALLRLIPASDPNYHAAIERLKALDVRR